MLSFRLFLVLSLVSVATSFAPRAQKALPLTVQHMDISTEYLQALDVKSYSEPSTESGINDVTTQYISALDVKSYSGSKVSRSDEKLVRLGNDVLKRSKVVLFAGDLASDFEFCDPVVGPIGKKEYLETYKNYDILTAFPDYDAGIYNVHSDPIEPNKVWFATRAKGTNTGRFMGSNPTGRKLELPPEMSSMTFDASGKVKQLTTGYVLDRNVGNTGGVGGVYGLLYGAGRALPFREARPSRPSLRLRLYNLMKKIRGKN